MSEAAQPVRSDVDACGLWDIVGAERTVSTLRRMVEVGQVPHALLLSGPAQVGKARLALELACAVNCQGEDCRQCARIRGSKHADVEIVAPGGLTLNPSTDSSNDRVISIGQIRRLERLAVTHPYEGRRRVFIVDPADAMTNDAADAFLKTLEEPGTFVNFVLVTSRPELVSETIRSRCLRLDVPPLSTARFAEWLAVEHALEPEQAETLARMAQGRVGRALDAMAEGDAFALRNAQIEEIQRLSEEGRGERFKFSEGLAGRGFGEPVNALLALQHWTAWWRDLLLAASGCGASVTHRGLGPQLAEAAERYRPADIVRFLLALAETERRLREGVNARLALDTLFTQIPTPRRKPRPVEVRN
jgi:DNA polymerase-3 subunit delta'